MGSASELDDEDVGVEFEMLGDDDCVSVDDEDEDFDFVRAANLALRDARPSEINRLTSF
jgi:hypothetical protein